MLLVQSVLLRLFLDFVLLRFNLVFFSFFCVDFFSLDPGWFLFRSTVLSDSSAAAGFYLSVLQRFQLYRESRW